MQAEKKLVALLLYHVAQLWNDLVFIYYNDGMARTYKGPRGVSTVHEFNNF